MDIEVAAQEMFYHMGNLQCPVHDWQEPQIGTFHTPNGLGLMPECCYANDSMISVFQFDRWNEACL